MFYTRADGVMYPSFSLSMQPVNNPWWYKDRCCFCRGRDYLFESDSGRILCTSDKCGKAGRLQPFTIKCEMCPTTFSSEVFIDVEPATVAKWMTTHRVFCGSSCLNKTKVNVSARIMYNTGHHVTRDFRDVSYRATFQDLINLIHPLEKYTKVIGYFSFVRGFIPPFDESKLIDRSHVIPLDTLISAEPDYWLVWNEWIAPVSTTATPHLPDLVPVEEEEEEEAIVVRSRSNSLDIDLEVVGVDNLEDLLSVAQQQDEELKRKKREEEEEGEKTKRKPRVAVTAGPIPKSRKDEEEEEEEVEKKKKTVNGGGAGRRKKKRETRGEEEKEEDDPLSYVDPNDQNNYDLPAVEHANARGFCLGENSIRDPQDSKKIIKCGFRDRFKHLTGGLLASSLIPKWNWCEKDEEGKVIPGETLWKKNKLHQGCGWRYSFNGPEHCDIRTGFSFLTDKEAEAFEKTYPQEQAEYIICPYVWMDKQCQKLFPGARAWYVVVLPIDQKHKKRFPEWEELLKRNLSKGGYYSGKFLKNLSQVITESGLDVAMRKALDARQEEEEEEDENLVTKKAKVDTFTNDSGLGIRYQGDEGLEEQVNQQLEEGEVVVVEPAGANTFLQQRFVQ